MKNLLSLTLLILISVALSAQQDTADLLLKNGKIIDGAGNSWYYGDIAIKDGKILKIAKNLNINSAKTIDAAGLIIAPGFIDVHGHIEGSVIKTPTADNYIFDGVTTVVTGNCGGSVSSIPKFFRRIDSVGPSINVATLIGHNTVREKIMKRDNRSPTTEEQRQMEMLVEQAMKDGAVGLSTGLIYIPGTFSKTEEVVGLAKAAARQNGVYSSHIRDEENHATEAITEAINIGKAANIPVEISHFKIGGKVNWGTSSRLLALVDDARKEGYDVTIDQYPYTASSTGLSARLPSWVFGGGNDSAMLRLKNPEIRKQIKREMLEKLKSFKFKNYSYAMVAGYSTDPSYNGKSISEINKLMGRKPKAKYEAETMMDMVAKGGAQMVYHWMSEEDVKTIMKYPFSMVGADAGIPVPGKGVPHPRGYGTNARILGKYVREEKVISLEEAIRRMTSLAAQKFNLKDRGLLKEGFAADIVIFDANTVKDNSTFEKPHAYSTGFKHVIVNGQLVIENEKHLGTKSGKALYGPAYAGHYK